MYNALVIFCLMGIASMFLWSIESLKSKVVEKADSISDKRRAYNRNTPSQQELYRKDYWIKRNRDNMFECEVIVSGK